MTFTYTPGSGTSKDSVRLLVGDTRVDVSEDMRLEDEEIESLFTLFGTNVLRVAAEAADALAAKFARKAEGAVGPERIQPMSRAAEMRATATRLRSKASAHAIPVAGGISVSGKAAAAGDTDRSAPSFTRDLLDHPDGNADA